MQMLADPVFEKPIIISNIDYRFLIQEQLAAIGADADIVLEPMRRDSAPAIAVASEIAAARNPENIVAVFAADHVVRDRPALVELCKAAAVPPPRARSSRSASSRPKPRRATATSSPARRSQPAARSCAVEAFVEKPDRETAERYVADGYFWNGGNFIFRADRMIDEIGRFEPEIGEAARAALAAARHDLGFLVLDADAFRAGAEDLDRLCGDGAREECRRHPGRHRLVGCRHLARGVGIVRPRRDRQFHPRPRPRHGRAATCMCARTII